MPRTHVKGKEKTNPTKCLSFDLHVCTVTLVPTHACHVYIHTHKWNKFTYHSSSSLVSACLSMKSRWIHLLGSGMICDVLHVCTCGIGMWFMRAAMFTRTEIRERRRGSCFIIPHLVPSRQDLHWTSWLASTHQQVPVILLSPLHGTGYRPVHATPGFLYLCGDSNPGHAFIAYALNF